MDTPSAPPAPPALPAVVCAENIAVLSVLHTVPQRPSAHEMDPGLIAASASSGHALSIAEERQLVGALSFLAGVSDNARDIAAVCVQELGSEARTESLQLVIAANKADAGDNNALVDRLKSGFERVLQPLSTMQPGDDALARKAIEESVFSAIIAMCSKRIQQRLRLVSSNKRKKKKKKKQPFKAVLEQANRAFKKNEERREKHGPLIAGITRVTELFTDLAGHQVEARVGRLVEGVCQLCQETDVCGAVASIGDEEMQRGSRDCLVSILTKVARYRETARFLCRMAAQEDRPLVRRWTVVPATLPASAFGRPDTANTADTADTAVGRPDLASAMARACGRRAAWTAGELQYMFALLGTTQDRASAAFCAHVGTSLGESKVHAEMQLVAYCELCRTCSVQAGDGPGTGTGHGTVPRIIRSHKAACFLCSLFITQACFRTSYYTSQSHGRLYPGWRLPQCFGAAILAGFNALLERQVSASIDALQTRRAKTDYPHPAESALTALGSVADAAPPLVTVTVADGSTSPTCRAGQLALQVAYAKQAARGQLRFSVEQLTGEEAGSLGMDHKVCMTDVGRLAAGGAVGGRSVDRQGCLYLVLEEEVYRVRLVFA